MQEQKTFFCYNTHMSHEAHPRPEFAIPPSLVSRPLNTVILWEPKKAGKHLSAVHRVGALSDDLTMLQTEIASKNNYVQNVLQESAKKHAQKIISANIFYQQRIGKELKNLASIKPEMAERTSKYLSDMLINNAKSAQQGINESKKEKAARHYSRIAERLGVAFTL